MLATPASFILYGVLGRLPVLDPEQQVTVVATLLDQVVARSTLAPLCQPATATTAATRSPLRIWSLRYGQSARHGLNCCAQEDCPGGTVSHEETVVALEEYGFYDHSLPLEDARAQAAHGQHSQVGKILEIHQELPGRIHVVLIRQAVGC